MLNQGMPKAKPNARILIVEDDIDAAMSYHTLMENQGHNVTSCRSGEEAIRLLSSGQDFDLVLLELILPGLQGWDVLNHLKTDGRLRYVPVVAISSLSGQFNLQKALELGAEDYLIKPVEAETLLSRVKVLLRIRTLYEELIVERFGCQRAQRTLELKHYLASVMGSSAQIQELGDVLDNVAATDTTVLLEGESGTGKGLLAETIHRFSKRAQGPLVVVNCSAYPETLLSSELFGHEKGSFTGAIKRKLGRFEQADGGTIFLDEVAEISPLTQLALLRVLQDHQFERVGGEKTLTTDVRIIAATNKRLAEMVEKNLFREDLYYRLNVVRLDVPALRDRPDDIPFLSKTFLGSHSEKLGKSILGFSRETLTRLLQHNWPGNVRELRNVIEHSVLMCQGDVLEVNHLPASLAQNNQEAPAAAKLGRLKDQERRMIESTLEQVGWNKYRAAQLLGIARSTLYGKMKKLGIKPPK